MATITRLGLANYMKLVRGFPLCSIRSDTELNAARSVLDSLLRKELVAGEQDYLDALSDLIEQYERAARPMPDADEGAVLQLLMEGLGLDQSTLAAKVDIARSTISAVLAKRRSLTKDHILKLATFFDVSPSVFLPRSESAALKRRVPPKRPAGWSRFARPTLSDSGMGRPVQPPAQKPGG